MSISSNIIISREKAIKRLYNIKLYAFKLDLIRALNSYTNDELASCLHTDTAFYEVEGKYKLELEDETK